MQRVGKRAGATTPESTVSGVIAASPLQTELAVRILQLLAEQGAGPGHHLVEQDLCRQFGVSRTPIRGALKLLAAQGTLQARPHRGYILRRPVRSEPEVASAALRFSGSKKI